MSSAASCHVAVRSLNILEDLQTQRKQPILHDDNVERTVIVEKCFSTLI